MPSKSLPYHQVKFSPEAIGAGAKEFWDIAARRRARLTRKPSALVVRLGQKQWTHDREQEFFTDYANSTFAIYAAAIAQAR